ncbi:MAG: pilus assembly protein N-terminal domain-containing protein [Acidobacteriia bacterium]|nr:pilus assembly protein N-terminal domain-containing protein [Terriglobia bacterium]
MAAVCGFLCLPALAQQQSASSDTASIEKWTVTVGKSLVMDSPLPIERLSVADGNLADAVAIGPKEVLINGKAPGETSLVVWQKGGSRLLYDLTVRVSPAKMEALRQQIAREYPDQDISVSFDNDSVFLRGTVKDVIAGERLTAMASTMGKVINLLRVDVPPVEAQILVKVRFASVDRGASRDLAFNFATGAFNQQSAISNNFPISMDGGKSFSLTDAVNILLLRRDINLVATLKALESKNLLEILAEPTVPAINGKPASFLAGGQFPFPMVQPGSGGGGAVVTISWREYGVRLNFLPVVTPRGTIRLQVAPEVSSLDYTHAVSVQGSTVPALSTRRVDTEIELESGQSFVIAGLIDNQTTESFSKIPGIGDIPVLGKLFQTKLVTRNSGELLVIVTPEIVRPIPAGQPVPELNNPKPFMPPNTATALRQPGMDKTGPVPVNAPSKTMPLEQLLQQQKQAQPEAPANVPPMSPAQPPPTGGGGGTAK